MWNGTEIEIEVLLIRHGKTKANEEHRYLGRTEQALSKAGVEQMKACRSRLRGFVPDLLFVSPMKRCRESASILFEDKMQYVIREWPEMDFGRYEGKNWQELKDNAGYRKWIDSNGMLPIPEGESRNAFCKRCLKGFVRAQRITEDFCGPASGREHREKRESPLYIAAVVHGGTIMALMSALDGGSYFDYQAANGCGYHLRIVCSSDFTEIIYREEFV